MGKLSLLNKNAFLSIFANRSGLHATLAYSHYEIDRSYVFTDKTVIDWENDPVEEYDFWLQYIESLGEKFEWNFLESSFSKFSMGKVKEFEDEGDGVVAIRFLFDGNLEARSRSMNAIQGYFPEITVEILDNKKVRDLLSKVAIRLGYTDALLLDVNLHRFDLYRSRVSDKTRSAKLSDLNDKPWESSYCKISWDSDRALVEKLKDARLKAFSSVDTDSEQCSNLWGNLVCDEFSSGSGMLVGDLVRSYATVQLISLFNSDEKFFSGIGQGVKPTLIIVTGELLGMMNEEQLNLALFDGLQLRGTMDMQSSKGYEFFALGDELVQGVNARNYITTVTQVVPHIDRLMLPDIPGRPEEKKAIFMANLTEKGKGERTVYALTPNISRILLPEDEYVVDGDFSRGAYIEGSSLEGLSGGEKRNSKKGEGFIWHSGQQSVPIRKLVIDARFKPVVYGPDYRTNRNKISSWLGE